MAAVDSRCSGPPIGACDDVLPTGNHSSTNCEQRDVTTLEVVGIAVRSMAGWSEHRGRVSYIKRVGNPPARVELYDVIMRERTQVIRGDARFS